MCSLCISSCPRSYRHRRARITSKNYAQDILLFELCSKVLIVRYYTKGFHKLMRVGICNTAFSQGTPGMGRSPFTCLSLLDSQKRWRQKPVIFRSSWSFVPSLPFLSQKGPGGGNRFLTAMLDFRANFAIYFEFFQVNTRPVHELLLASLKFTLKPVMYLVILTYHADATFKNDNSGNSLWPFQFWSQCLIRASTLFNFMAGKS